jgi:hypothetical protein
MSEEFVVSWSVSKSWTLRAFEKPHAKALADWLTKLETGSTFMVIAGHCQRPMKFMFENFSL